MNKHLTFGIAAALMAFSLTAAESPAQFEEKIGSLIKENRTAGMAVVVVSGERFDEYILNHILKPIGAKNAGFNLDTLDRTKEVKLYGYSKKRDKLYPGGGYLRINELLRHPLRKAVL